MMNKIKKHYIDYMKNGILERKYFYNYTSASKWGKENLINFKNERIKYKKNLYNIKMRIL
jgi:hypothetical protein